MTYATLCSGIDGIGLALDEAGMACVFQCEQDKHCLRVLRRHWPSVPKTTDVNDEQTRAELIRLRPNVVAFGSPCQDLSTAGKRGGLSAQRSGLFYQCVDLCFACQADVVLWENVPGVFSSNDGEDFACVLAAFTGFHPEVPRSGWRDTGVCVGPLYSVAWAVLDAQWFGLAQRRKRVFVVGHLGDRGFGYEVLALGESVPWDSPPSREARTDVPNGGNDSRGPRAAAAVNAKGGSGRMDFESENFVVGALQSHQVKHGHAMTTQQAAESGHLVASTLNSAGNNGGFRTEPGEHLVAHCLKAEGHDASEDGTGRGVPLVTAFQERGREGGRSCESQEDVAYSLNNPGNGGRRQECNVAGTFGVRRLTPLECEKLQGLPPDFTRYGDDGKEISDSARYRMIGNSVAVPVLSWIAKRIVSSST